MQEISDQAAGKHQDCKRHDVMSCLQLELVRTLRPAHPSQHRMMQRTTYFSGVYIVVMKLTYTPGTKGKIEDILYNTFSRNANPPSPNTPKINRTYVNAKLYASASPPDLWSRAHASMDTRRSVNKKGQVTSNAGGR
jgi:hypothetical protein